jgi:hypothetical protein
VRTVLYYHTTATSRLPAGAAWFTAPIKNNFPYTSQWKDNKVD